MMQSRTVLRSLSIADSIVFIEYNRGTEGERSRGGRAPSSSYWGFVERRALPRARRRSGNLPRNSRMNDEPAADEPRPGVNRPFFRPLLPMARVSVPRPPGPSSSRTFTYTGVNNRPLRNAR